MDDKLWQQRVDRERRAREEAEQALESISQRLYEANQSLLSAQTELEARVEDRTLELQATVSQLETENRLRRQAEAELRSSRDAALEVSQLKSQFLARMSHEIRTPLNAIIGFTGLMLDSELKPRQREQMATVRSSGQLLLRIINDLLDLSKIDAGKVELEYEPAPLDKLIEQAVALVLLEASEKKIQIVVEEDASVVEHLNIDAARVQQILLNLLTNAVKYSDSGVVTIAVRQQAVATAQVPKAIREQGLRGHEDWISLSVSVHDQGVGIEPDHLASLFDPFVQINPGAFGAGSGLGLAICQRLSRIMGGDISVDSRLGEGSTFEFSVLCQLAESGDPGATSQVTTRRLKLAPGGAFASADPEDPHRHIGMAIDKPLSVLLADDYQVNRMVQQAQLDALGYRADMVCNGEEVLHALEARPYDVILMDIRMPVMDGLEASRRIRARPNRPQPFIVAVSASLLSEHNTQFAEAGIDAWVSKPVDIEKLAEALDQAYARNSDGAAGSSEQLAPVMLDLDPLYAQLGAAADQLMRQVIPVYLREMGGRQKGLKQALEKKDVEMIGHLCHGLKGASRSVGATELAQLCETCEQAARDGRLPDAQQIDAIVSLSERTARTLKSRLSQLSID